MARKILIGFYKGSVDDYMQVLEKFDDDSFIVHIYDSVDNQALEEFNLENILNDALGGDYKKHEINIISNMENLILDLFKKYGFEYNSFIFDNSLHDCKEYIVSRNEENICENNYNLYSLKTWVDSISYTLLNDTDIYNISMEKVKNYINSAKEMCKESENFLKYYNNTNIKSINLKEYINKLEIIEKQKIEELFIAELEDKNEAFLTYIYSFLVYTFKKKAYGDKLLDITSNSKILDKNNKFFIIYQLIQKSFTDSEINSSVCWDSMYKIYDNVFEEFEQAVGEYEFIPKSERNKDLIFVFTSQFLTQIHGPTKTALDRCYSLIKYMNKKVILINTMELVTNKGIVPIDNIFSGNIIREYTSMNTFAFKDVKIPYYQPECFMPNEVECKNILDIVKKHKPYLLLNIGGYSITADLCSKIVPMATISTSGNYSISKTKGQFFIMGRKPVESDYRYIEKLGYTRDAIIESPFTFYLKPQKNNYSRNDFGLPKDKFIVAFIGARLQREIDEDFIKTLDKLASKGCFIASIGGYKIPHELVNKYPELNNNFKDLGMQNDILACIELIDLYVNPKRQGGGTSAVECMHKGKPVVSLRYGDVSMLVNEKSLVENYDEMKELVIKCMEEKNIYNEMSNLGKEKASDLMDSKKYFKKMYYDIIQSPLFK